MYQIGAYLVKIGRGICRVDGVQSMAIPHSRQTALYYRLTPLEERGSVLYVPAEGAEEELRELIGREEALRLIRLLPRLEGAPWGSDKERGLAYKEALKDRDPEALAVMVKDLYDRRRQRQSMGKKVSVTDERLFRQSEERLFSELAFALGREREEIPGLILEAAGGECAPV